MFVKWSIHCLQPIPADASTARMREITRKVGISNEQLHDSNSIGNGFNGACALDLNADAVALNAQIIDNDLQICSFMAVNPWTKP